MIFIQLVECFLSHSQGSEIKKKKKKKKKQKKKTNKQTKKPTQLVE
jgi:hypothetical protein